jgi:hypothetical protein
VRPEAEYNATPIFFGAVRFGFPAGFVAVFCVGRAVSGAGLRFRWLVARVLGSGGTVPRNLRFDQGDFGQVVDWLTICYDGRSGPLLSFHKVFYVAGESLSPPIPIRKTTFNADNFFCSPTNAATSLPSQ